MSRVQECFARLRLEGRKGLVAYVTAGDPDAERSEAVVRGLVRGGADLVELGVPFSDPIADGPSIQRASERALAAGGNLASTLALVRKVRDDVNVPIVLFTYVNPVLRMGPDPFMDRAASAGVDGVLLLDLPIEEAGTMQEALARRGLDLILLVSPTTSDARLAAAAQHGRGFLYAISRLGVTGAREAVAVSAAPLVARLRSATTLPIALGFGVSRPEHVAEIWNYADAAVVGSAIVDAVHAATVKGQDPGIAAERFVAWLRGA